MERNCIDPFGAPEFLIDGVGYREMIGTELVRTVFVAYEQGASIVRCKLLIPVRVVAVECLRARDFALAGQEKILM